MRMAAEGTLTPEAAEPLWREACAKLKAGDRPPFRQVTFTLHDNQWTLIQKALKRAKQNPDRSGKNKNANGNAITRICRQWLRSAAS